MARKKRDYKAEYARRKARSQALGYRSPKQEYRARKAIGLRRGFPSLRFNELPDVAYSDLSGGSLGTMRRECQNWSDRHSHVKSSKYDPTFSNQQVKDYYRAYVEPYENIKKGRSRRGAAKEKSSRIYHYLVKHGFPVEGTPENWKSDPDMHPK